MSSPPDAALSPPLHWPELSYAAWKDTCATLHLWTQVVGKIRLALTPWLNHSWHVTLNVTARGLARSGCGADDVLAKHLRRLGRSRQMGPRGT